MLNIHLSHKVRIKNGINRRWQRKVLLFGGINFLEFMYFFSCDLNLKLLMIPKNIIRNRNWKIKGCRREGSSQMGHLSSMHMAPYYIPRISNTMYTMFYSLFKEKKNNTYTSLENTKKSILWMLNIIFI